MMLAIGTGFEVAGGKDALYITIGRLGIVMERSTYKPAKWLEVWREPEGNTGLHYNSPHCFAFGRRLFWSVEARRQARDW